MHCITENWEYIRKRKKVSLHLGWRKGYILADFSFIWSFDVLNCNKQPLSVHWSSNMGCRSIVRLRFNSTLNHSLLSPRKIYLWNHWAVIVKWNLLSSFYLTSHLSSQQIAPSFFHPWVTVLSTIPYVWLKLFVVQRVTLGT